jgi:hypothetical protein
MGFTSKILSAIPSVLYSSGSEGSAPENKTVQHVPLIPRSDIGVLRTAQDVLQNWDAAKYPLDYAAKAKVQQAVSNLELFMSSVRTVRADRSPEGKQLDILDEEINTNIEPVKGYLTEQYGKKLAKSHYPAFGIEQTSDKYNLPGKRSLRVRALKMLLQGIEKYGYGDKKYGTEYWTAIYEEYASLEASVRDNDGLSTRDAAAKNQSKMFCIKWLRSIALIIEANHPDDYMERLRSLGFQKEKY